LNSHPPASKTAVVYYAPQDVRVENVEINTQLEPGEALVRVEACAICGTDVKTYFKGNPRLKPPMVMGHEFCGIIEQVGSSETNYSVGQRVTMATTIGCGECIYCRVGKTNLCRAAEAMSFHYPGAMAPYVRIPCKAVRQKHLVDVGDLDPALASLGEPLSCVVNSLSRIPLEDIETMVVIGMGPLGLLHAIAAQSKGVQTICCVARPGKRYDMAGRMGFDCVLTPEQLDEKYKDYTDGEGFDLVIITAPDNQVQTNSSMYARKGGYVSLFASLPVGDEMLTVNSRTIHYNELVVYGTSDSTPFHVQEAVRLLHDSSELVSLLVTHKLPFSKFHEAMDAIKARDAVKVVLFPG